MPKSELSKIKRDVKILSQFFSFSEDNCEELAHYATEASVKKNAKKKK